MSASLKTQCWLCLGLALGCTPLAGAAEMPSEPEQLRYLRPPRVGEEPIVAALRSALNQGDLSRAARNMSELASFPRQNGEAEYWSGLLSLRQGDAEHAVRALRKSQKAQDSPYTAEALALAYYSLRQFRLFETTMRKAAEQLPQDSAPLYYLGRYYISVDRGDFVKAEHCFWEALQQNPTDPTITYYVGLAQEYRRNLQGAETTYKKVLQLSSPPPPATLAALGLARVSFLENRFADALSYALRAEAASPHNPETHELLGKIYVKLENSTLALQEWETAAALNAQSSTAYYHLYQLYRQSGQAQKAEKALGHFKELIALYGAN